MNNDIKTALLDAAHMLDSAYRNFNVADPTLVVRGQYKMLAKHIYQLISKYEREETDDTLQ